MLGILGTKTVIYNGSTWSFVFWHCSIAGEDFLQIFRLSLHLRRSIFDIWLICFRLIRVMVLNLVEVKLRFDIRWDRILHNINRGWWIRDNVFIDMLIYLLTLWDPGCVKLLLSLKIPTDFGSIAIFVFKKDFRSWKGDINILNILSWGLASSFLPKNLKCSYLFSSEFLSNFQISSWSKSSKLACLYFSWRYGLLRIIFICLSSLMIFSFSLSSLVMVTLYCSFSIWNLSHRLWTSCTYFLSFSLILTV